MKAKPQKYFTDERKEYYKLWYRYLKRNEDYEKFCEWIQNEKTIKDEPVRIDLSNTKLGLKGFAALPIFTIWRDVYTLSFEEWWELIIKNSVPFAPIQECDMWLKRAIDFVIDGLIKTQGREPTVYELRENLVRLLERGYNGKFIYLQIDLRPGCSYSEVEKRFKKIVEPRMKKLLIKQFPNFSQEPPSVLKKDELDRYLFEYELHYPKQGKGLKVDEIIQKVASEKQYGKAHWTGKENEKGIHDVVNQDLKKAKRIISNTLSNVFPGQYDYTKNRRKAKLKTSVS